MLELLFRIIQWWRKNGPSELIVRSGHAVLNYLGFAPNVVGGLNTFIRPNSGGSILHGLEPSIDITTGSPPMTPTVSELSGVATASYTPIAGERNKPPTIDDVTISTNNAYGQGDTLTANIVGVMHGPYTAGTHQYQWYRLASPTGALTAIAGATNSTYVLQAADIDAYIVCAARFVQTQGFNTISDWFYTIPTPIITVSGVGGGPQDINHPWEDFLDIESGASIPANWNTAGVSPTLTNFGTGGTPGTWDASDTSKPVFSTNKLVFSGSHRVNGASQTFPPVVEIWIKGRFTANNGAMIGWGSQTLFGMNSSNQWFIRDIVMMTGDLNEHVFRIVLNGANSKFQVDNGTEVTFTQNFTTASILALGQTYSGANFADCEIKRFQKTVDGTVLTTQEVIDKWAYHGFASTVNGLSADYFNNINLQGSPVLSRLDPNVDFSWGSGAPAAGVNSEMFSVRWRGKVEAPVSGDYIFSTNVDDGNRLWVNGLLVINDWNDGAAHVNNSIPVTLQAGVKYDIVMEYYENCCTAVAQLSWSYPGQANQIIPTQRLFPNAFNPDNQAPSIPSNLASSNITSSSFTVTWNASTDNVGVTGYEVFRNGVSIATPAGTSYVVSGLSPSTQYAITVRARDAAGNWSAQSGVLNVTTSAASGGGTKYYVALTGNDTTGNGSQANPWRTVAKAVTTVPANVNATISIGAGTFVESSYLLVPTGVNIEGAGIGVTILQPASNLYFQSFAWIFDKFLLILQGGPAGNQSVKHLTINGANKQLYGGITVKDRNNVLIENVRVEFTYYTGIWMWNTLDCRITGAVLKDCAWGSSTGASGSISVSICERLEIDHCNFDESYGQALDAVSSGKMYDLNVHDNRFSVSPIGNWTTPEGHVVPNICVELYEVTLRNCQFYNNYFDNVFSIVMAEPQFTTPTGQPTIRVYNNTFDLITRAGGSGYGIELTVHDAEIDHNYFIGGSAGIVNWDASPSPHTKHNWKIHHNVFERISSHFPSAIINMYSTGSQNAHIYNNTVEMTGADTIHFIEVNNSGVVNNAKIENNLIIDNNTSYRWGANKFISLVNGGTMTNGSARNNFLETMALGSVGGVTYSGNLSGNPQIVGSGNHPTPFYELNTGSPCINAGVIISGLGYLGSAPDIGAYEKA